MPLKRLRQTGTWPGQTLALPPANTCFTACYYDTLPAQGLAVPYYCAGQAMISRLLAWRLLWQQASMKRAAGLAMPAGPLGRQGRRKEWREWMEGGGVGGAVDRISSPLGLRPK